jgi:hypothetical protein
VVPTSTAMYDRLSKQETTVPIPIYMKLSKGG